MTPAGICHIELMVEIEEAWLSFGVLQQGQSEALPTHDQPEHTAKPIGRALVCNPTGCWCVLLKCISAAPGFFYCMSAQLRSKTNRKTKGTSIVLTQGSPLCIAPELVCWLGRLVYVLSTYQWPNAAEQSIACWQGLEKPRVMWTLYT